MEELTWGILLAAYLFIGGLAGGAYIIGAISDLFGKRERYKILSKSGTYVSLIGIILGLVILVLDLKRFEVAPLSILNAYLHFPTSIMTVGTWIITAFTIVALLTSILWFSNGVSWVRKLLEIAGLVLGVSTAAYTGLLLSFSRGRPFWSSPFLPWTFIVSGTLTGLVMAVLMIPIISWFMPRFFEDFKGLVDDRTEFTNMILSSQRYGAILIIIEFVLLIVELATGHGTEVIFNSYLNIPFFFYVILGLLIPLAIIYLCEKITIDSSDLYPGLFIPASLLGCVLILIGGFLLRYVILTAGQIV